MTLALQWMRHFNIGLRMHGAIAVVLLLFALVAGLAWQTGTALAGLNQQLGNQSLNELQRVAQLRQHLGNVRRYEKDAVIALHHRDSADKRQAQWRAATAQLRQALQAAPHGTPLQAAAASVQAYADGVDRALQAARADPARAPDSRALDQLLAGSKQQIYAVEQVIDQDEQQAQARAVANRQAFDQQLARAGKGLAAVLALVVVAVVPLTLVNSRAILAPIHHARAVALAIAQGDLTRRIHTDGRDETSELLRALAQMQDALGALVADVRGASDNIHRASHEVASGNLDLSQRTEQAAGQLQHTAGAMHQLTQHVQHSAEAAQAASGLAGSASQVAGRGGTVVAQVVQTMGEIHAASRRIGDIIGTIDGIAFQTNILALNAAVEAARAGESGRGFAVVAAEVRSLAQRAASAAQEIKTLVGASVDKVEAGTRLVQDAGHTMTDIVASVERVAQTIHDITATTGEQSQGISGVNSAVAQLDGMTQQNAALVQHSAAAAQSLSQQASRLADTVSRFQLA